MTKDRQIVYFHGTPGSAAELDFLDKGKRVSNLDIFVPERQLENSEKGLPAYFNRLAREIESRFPNGKIEIVGFSLGTYVALNVAASLSGRIETLHLISVAAPLHWGDYLDTMAGKAVFLLAEKRPRVFGALTSFQSLIARYFPGFLAKALFATAQGVDAELILDSNFKTMTVKILKDGLGRNVTAYKAEILGYVQDWQPNKDWQGETIVLWHGDQDNWSPIQMARDMKAFIGERARLQEFSGLSHYSTLQLALGKILSEPIKTLE